MAGADVKLPDISYKVKGDSKQATDALDNVAKSSKKTGDNLTGMQKTAKTAISDVASSLTSNLGPASKHAQSALEGIGTSGSLMGPAVVAGAALAGAAVAKFALDGAQQFVALAGEVREFQRASGASAEDSSRFVAVLDDLGVSSETGAKALFKLGKNVADGGTELAKYGVEVAHTKDGTADLTGTLLNVADAYAANPDPAKRAELAMAAFGKAGQQLIPVLEQGREGLKAFFEGAESGRQIFSQADLDKARKYELAIDDLQDTFRGMKLEAGEALLPYLTTLAQATTKTLAFTDDLKAKAPGVFESLKATAAGAVAGPIGQLVDILGRVGGKSDTTKQSTKELAEEVKREATAAQEANEALEAHIKALDRVTNATLAAVSAKVGYESSLNRLKDSINDIDDREREYADAVDASKKATDDAAAAVRIYGSSSDEAKAAVEKASGAAKDAESANRALRDAHLGVREAALNTAAAAVKLADDTATAGGETLSAQDKSRIFQGALRDLAEQASGPTRQAILDLAGEIDAIPNRTVTVDADTSAASDKIQSLQRQMNSIEAGANSISGPQQFARGMDMGPVRGRPGSAVPIIAHAGEWVLTPEQLSRIGRNGEGGAASSVPVPSGPGPSTPPVVHTTIVVDRKVLAEATSRGQYEARRR